MPKKKDNQYVSTEKHEVNTIVRRFKSYKTDRHLRPVDLKIIHALMTENLGRVKRADLYLALSVMGFGRDPMLDKK